VETLTPPEPNESLHDWCMRNHIECQCEKCERFNSIHEDTQGLIDKSLLLD
jgi:hypothetical protein